MITLESQELLNVIVEILQLLSNSIINDVEYQ